MRGSAAPLLVAGALLIAVWAGYALQMASIDRRAHDDALQRSAQIVASYETDVTATLNLVDNVLRFLATYAAENGIDRTLALIRERHLQTREIGSISVVDRQGRGRFIAEGRVGESFLGDRQFLQPILDGSSDLLIAKPIVGQNLGRAIVPFARSILADDGTAIGAVTAGVEPQIFALSYDEGDLGHEGVLLLIGSEDHVIRTRNLRGSASVGTNPIGPALLDHMRDAPQGTFWQVSNFDHILRAYSYRKLADYPLFVVSGIAYDDYAERNAGLRKNLFFAALVASIFACSLVAAWMQQRAARRTAQHAQGAAEAATRLKSEFLANMSHEIRTPMNAILGLSHLVLGTSLDARQRDYLLKIRSSATALLGLINDILDFSKIEAGKLEIERVPFNLASVVEGVTSVCGVAAAAKQLELLVELAPDLPLHLVGDPLRLGQVLLNLVGNAVKFTARGEVILSVAAAGRSADLVKLRIAVRDTGVGMDEAQLARLFHPFTQADGSTTRRFGGSGLGLAICKTLVDMMGGSIAFESRPGHGTCATLELAFAIDRDEAPRAAPDLADLRVLLVGGTATAREILGRMLTAWSVAHVDCASGIEAVAAVEAAAEQGAPFHLALIERRMPEMDGIETARLMQRLASGAKPPAVFLLVAPGDEGVEPDKGAELQAVLGKPLGSSTLLDAILTQFGRAPLQASRGERRTHPRRRALAGMRLLLVEDNDINLQIASEMLADAGAIVEVARNGRAAVETLTNDIDFHAVLMDLQMPEMDGITATRLIRRRVSAERLPIIAMTAHAMQEEKQRCLDAGMNDHIAKPIDPAGLIGVLCRWVRPPAASAAPPVEAAAPPPAAPETQLPEHLPPFDIPDALVRLAGKRALLYRLLIRFHQEFADAAHELRHHLAAGRQGEAEQLVHKLVGTGGSLGAHRLAEAARALEQAIHDHRDCDIAALTDDFESALNSAMQAVAGLAAADATQKV